MFNIDEPGSNQDSEPKYYKSSKILVLEAKAIAKAQGSPQSFSVGFGSFHKFSLDDVNT